MSAFAGFLRITRIAITAVGGCAVLAGARAGAVQLRAGDLLVTDSANARVLLVKPDTGAVTPFSPRASSGPNLLFAPAGIAIDPDGVVFVADSFADRIVTIDPVTGAQAVLTDWSAQFGDFGPADVGTAPEGLDLEDTVDGFDRRDLFVASEDGVHRVARSFDSSSSALLSGGADLQSGTDVAVQQNGTTDASLFVVANGVLVRYFFADGSTQALTATSARNVFGVEYAFGTALFTRNLCYQASSLNGLFLYDGTFDGVQLEGTGYASCLRRPLAVASPTLVYGSYGDDQLVALTPTIDGYDAAIVATLPAGDVASLAADLAVSPVTFPAPEAGRPALGWAAFFSLAGLRRRSRGGA